MEEFLKTYGPFVLLALFLVYLVAVNIYRTRKYSSDAKNLLESLKKGDYVKTYSGIYGKVVTKSEKTLANGQIERMIKLQLDENSFLSIDANAIYMVIEKVEEEKKAPAKKTTKPKVEEPKETN